MIRNRYKNPVKRAAFERALEIVKRTDLGPVAYIGIACELAQYYNLSRADRRDVAAKAVRIERWRRLHE